MQKIQEEWLVVTVFYNQHSWNKLIKVFISNLIGELRDNRQLLFFYIFLGTGRGDHVTLCLKYQNYDENILKIDLSRKLDLFLNHEKSEDNSLNFPLNSFLIDFSNNTYIFHRRGSFFPNDNWYVSALSKLRYIISKTIILLSRSDQISGETLFTIFFYFQIGMIRSAFPSLENAYKAIVSLKTCLKESGSSLIYSENDLYSKMNDYGLYSEFNKNKDVLIEIFDDVWRSNKSQPQGEWQWINLWIKQCSYFFRRVEFERSFFRLNTILIEHLGLPSKDGFAASSLVLLEKIVINYYI